MLVCGEDMGRWQVIIGGRDDVEEQVAGETKGRYLVQEECAER